MKRQWKIRRNVKEIPDAQSRWDRAYRLILEIAHSVEENQSQTKAEVRHASSNLCQGIHPTAGSSADD